MDRALVVDGSVRRARGLVGARRFVNERGVLVGLVAAALAFGALIGPRFFSAANLELMARQTVIVCVAALGMTMVIVSGGIDLSVGSVVALRTRLTPSLLGPDASAAGALVAAIGALAAGALRGALD